MKKIVVSLVAIIAVFMMVACGDIAIDKSNVDNTDNTTITDSYNEAEQAILDSEVQPNDDGTCPTGYFYCSIEQACLPVAENGGVCPLSHTDVEEAEADEENDNNTTGEES